MSTVDITPATQYLKRRMVYGELTPTKTTGNKYDGVLQHVDILGSTVAGYIFGATPRFADGMFIETSEIVRVSNILSSGWFIETISGSRYLIASVTFNPNLSGTTSSVEAAMRDKQKHIEINKDYFEPLQWHNH